MDWTSSSHIGCGLEITTGWNVTQGPRTDRMLETTTDKDGRSRLANKRKERKLVECKTIRALTFILLLFSGVFVVLYLLFFRFHLIVN